MQFNYSHDNDGYGYMFGSKNAGSQWSGNNVIRFNISQNDCRNSDYGALLFENVMASDVYAYNNSFYMSDNNLFVNTQKRPAPAIGFLAYGTAPNPPRINVFNNILFTESTRLPVITVQRKAFNRDAFDVRGLVFLGNNYYSKDRTVIQIRWPNMTLHSLVSFQKLTGQEMLGGSAVGTTADPELGFELNPAYAPAIYDLSMPFQLVQLAALFKLTSTRPRPPSVKEGGVDVVSILGQNWWTPSATNDSDWGLKVGGPQDLFHIGLPPKPPLPFSIGASQYVGPP